MKRRGIVLGVAAAGAALAAGLYRFTELFVRHYPPTPYDDLLQLLTDRDQAARLGARATGGFDAQSQATQLRAALKGRSLRQAVQDDIAAGRMVELEGWVLPETVAWLSVLAAKV